MFEIFFSYTCTSLLTHASLFVCIHLLWQNAHRAATVNTVCRLKSIFVNIFILTHGSPFICIRLCWQDAHCTGAASIVFRLKSLLLRFRSSREEGNLGYTDFHEFLLTAVCWRRPAMLPVCVCLMHCVAVCCSVLLCMLEVACHVAGVHVCRSVLQCIALCCSVLQCVAVWCRVLQCVPAIPRAFSRHYHRQVSVVSRMKNS